LKPVALDIPASATDWTQLASLLPHLHIIHHVRGRLRVRLHPGVSGWLAQWPNAAPESWLAQWPGIARLHLNKVAASLVIEYDAGRIPPQWWERLLRSPSPALPGLLAEIGLIADRDPLSLHSAQKEFIRE
jgi:hypothetical protein